jgi:hypothetical protein
MARKLPTPTPVENTALVKARTEGIQLLSPLQRPVDALTITNQADYILADNLLSRIRTARKLWATKLDPVRGPIDKAMKELKLALDGIKNLDREVDGPLEALEGRVKARMKEFKIAEARQIEEAQRKQDAEAERLRQEAAKKAQQATTAKTPALKARLEQARVDLEAQALLTENSVSTPVQAASSSTRKVQKVTITDPVAFLGALKAYEARAGIYEFGHPPLSILTHKTSRTGQMSEEDSALDVMRAEVSKIFSVQPGIVQSWPGVTVVDDVIIAAH